ncbi:MAG: thioredoxin domain-containing protein [Saprospiraceae bacterium]|nr:thioredoxin domain-containing protein [Saprospiraceae bacterium]
MKKNIFLSITLVLCFVRLQAQGIEFFHGTFAEALVKAQTENKLIFMDAFAEWCGPCKRMAATVFTDEKVGKFMNSNFICLKKDMEKGEGPELSRKFDVSAYPTLLFLSADGKLVQRTVGALPVDGFITTARQALGKIDNTKGFEKAYTEGKREPELIYNYVRALSRAGKPSLKIVNEFLQKADMTQPTTFKIIFEGTSQADSKVFDLLIKNRAAITTLYSEQQVKDRIEEAIEKTAANAVQFKSAELQAEAKAKMKAHLPDKAEVFAAASDMAFFKAVNDAKNYCKACETALKKEGKNDARTLYTIAKQMTDAFPEEKVVLNTAEKYLKKAAENGGLVEYYYLYAQTLHRNGKKNDALTNAEKALKLAKDTQMNAVPSIQQLIEVIKG